MVGQVPGPAVRAPIGVGPLRHFHQPTRHQASPTTLEDVFRGFARLRGVELADIPAGLRVSALEQHTTSLGNVVKPRAQCKQAVKILKKQAQGAKYQIYFGIAPIVTWAFQPPSVVRAVLLDCLLLQLRLLTMMR